MKLFKKHTQIRFQRSEGHTLLETVAYIAIFIVILVAVFDMMVTLSKSFARVRAFNDVKTAGVVTLERIAREVRTASSVNRAGSTLDAHPGNLLINTTDESGVVKTVEFYFDSAAKSINIVDGATDKGSLNGSSTEITNIIFRSASSTKSEAVKVEMTLRSKKITDVAVKFYDTIVMRGGY